MVATVLGRFGIVVVGLMVVFSGCLAGEETASDSTSPSPSTSAPTTSEVPTSSAPATTDAPAPNTPPTATLSASIENGTVPLNVTFNFTAQDADAEDELSWSLDADGDGAADASGGGELLPGNYTHSYSAEGLFNATLLVDDGEANSSANITIVVSASAPAGPIQEVDGDVPASTLPSCLLLYPEELEGIDHAVFDIDPRTFGLTFTLTFEVTAADTIGIDFVDAAGASLAEDSSGGDAITGEVPENAARAYIWGCAAVDVSFHYVSPGPAA
ncbi:MAG TPA: hypothetical protein VGB18_01415 [Candidatus Thermoplasmatota archaeon]